MLSLCSKTVDISLSCELVVVCVIVIVLVSQYLEHKL